ncbi:hypothetical protein OF83DRAFT_374983 [Amylostereum chailletii]|nr:hypothetical protein OF83DRAFT_374983 [Amylostereum chailletii]
MNEESYLTVTRPSVSGYCQYQDVPFPSSHPSRDPRQLLGAFVSLVVHSKTTQRVPLGTPSLFARFIYPSTTMDSLPDDDLATFFLITRHKLEEIKALQQENGKHHAEVSAKDQELGLEIQLSLWGELVASVRDVMVARSAERAVKTDQCAGPFPWRTVPSSHTGSTITSRCDIPLVMHYMYTGHGGHSCALWTFLLQGLLRQVRQHLRA